MCVCVCVCRRQQYDSPLFIVIIFFIAHTRLLFTNNVRGMCVCVIYVFDAAWKKGRSDYTVIYSALFVPDIFVAAERKTE